MSFSDIDPAEIVINVVVLLFSLSIHESAHAWAADRRGDFTARHMGRVSLNPLVHIDPIGTILFPLIGLLSGWTLFGWAKPVPVNPLHLRTPKRDHLLIAAAGPASNIVAAIAFVVALKILVSFFTPELVAKHAVAYPLFLLFQVGLYVNVILAVFNLVPIPPLDGSWVLAGLLPDRLSHYLDAVRPYSFLLLILLLWSGFLGIILSPVLAFVQGLVL